MDQIAWDMRYGSQTYLKFVARYLLQGKTEQPLVDPFAPDVPPKKVDVPPKKVEEVRVSRSLRGWYIRTPNKFGFFAWRPQQVGESDTLTTRNPKEPEVKKVYVGREDVEKKVEEVRISGSLRGWYIETPNLFGFFAWRPQQVGESDTLTTRNPKEPEVKEVYVRREDVEKEIGQPGNRIILGPEGSGKTTLFRKLPALLRSQTLIVRLPLGQIRAPVPEQDLMEGKCSSLSTEVLARYIFDAYWEDLLCAPAKRVKFLSELRQDQQWMTRLRWFYHHYRPLHHKIPEEFELMEWLSVSPSSEPFRPNVPEDTLRELIDFVTFRQERYGDDNGDSLSQPYAQIQILIDGTERLSNSAVSRLIRDAQRLFDLYLDHVQFKLFADSTLGAQIEKMNCVREGRVGIYYLPPWNSEELRQILNRRLEAEIPGAFGVEDNWGERIPENCLESDARTKFVKTIVNGVIRAYEEEKDLGAPIHVLRLARYLVAACAGCWAEQGYKPPLSIKQINDLIDLYWKNV